MVTVRFTFSRAENQRAMVYIALRNRAATGMLLMGVALLAGGIAVAKTGLIAVGGAEMALWVGLIGVLPAIGAGRMARDASEHTMSFSDDGVAAAGADGSARIEWRTWSRWSQTRTLYVLSGARRRVTFVPRRAFGSAADESEFRDLLTRHVSSRS